MLFIPRFGFGLQGGYQVGLQGGGPQGVLQGVLHRVLSFQLLLLYILYGGACSA